MVFSDLKQVLLFADVTEAFPESVRETGAVVRRSGYETELPEEGVSAAFDAVEVVGEEFRWIHFRIFLLLWGWAMRGGVLDLGGYSKAVLLSFTVCFFTNATKENLIAQLFVDLESSAWSHIKDN